MYPALNHVVYMYVQYTHELLGYYYYDIDMQNNVFFNHKTIFHKYWSFVSKELKLRTYNGSILNPWQSCYILQPVHLIWRVCKRWYWSLTQGRCPTHCNSQLTGICRIASLKERSSTCCHTEISPLPTKSKVRYTLDVVSICSSKCLYKP